MYPKPKFIFKQGKATMSKNGVKKQINKRSRAFEAKYLNAQKKLIEQVNSNFSEIKKCKEQKTNIAAEVFNYCES